MHHRVTLDGDPKATFECRREQTVLSAMNASGIRAIPTGCRSGGCGVCKVQVLSGEFDTGIMSRAQVDDTDRSCGFALACQLYPRSDLLLRRVRRTNWTGEILPPVSFAEVLAGRVAPGLRSNPDPSPNGRP